MLGRRSCSRKGTVMRGRDLACGGPECPPGTWVQALIQGGDPSPEAVTLPLACLTFVPGDSLAP